MPPVAHWDDLEPADFVLGPVNSRWRMLGDAGGSVGVGLRRVDIAPGGQSTPVHLHGAEEELFFILRGGGSSVQYEPTASGGFSEPRAYDVGPGDCVFHPPAAEAHAFVAGPDGLDLLAFGTRADTTGGHLPRTGAAWLAGAWTEVGQGDHPYAREAAAGPIDLPQASERPATIVNVADVPEVEWGRGDVRALRRDLGRTVGSRQTGIKHVRVQAGMLAAPPHCHSAEEEIFVVLEGDGTLALGDEEQPVRAGHAVVRPPGTGVSHAFTAGDDGMALLAYGTREHDDVCWYPRSEKVSLRGLGLIFRAPERLDYWDGEPG